MVVVVVKLLPQEEGNFYILPQERCPVVGMSSGTVPSIPHVSECGAG